MKFNNYKNYLFIKFLVISISIVTLSLINDGGILMAQQQGAAKNAADLKKTALFEYDNQKKEVISLLDGVKDYFKIKFVSLTTDQPVYWPDEDVNLKAVFPFCAGREVSVRIQKKGAAPIDAGKFKLNEAGIIVHTVLSGKQKKLQAGEYSVSVETADKKIYEYTTFTVVEGHLGAVSFAYEFEQLTNAEALREVNGGWFLGNAGGIGNRWGNGLNFKNQVRVLNQPYNGKATIKSLCHLPGCNGCEAGPAKEVVIKDGLLQGFLEVGGHSGPFELEVITDKGTVKNLFAKSGHVERQTSLISGGMTNVFYATLAPYEGCEQVSGRDIYIEKKTVSEKDVLLLNRPVTSNSGDIEIAVKDELNKVKAYQIYMDDSGNFAVKDIKIGPALKKGDSIKLNCAAPYTMIAVACFVNGQLPNERSGRGKKEAGNGDVSDAAAARQEKYYEAWAMIFTPPRIEIDVSAPAVAAPGSKQAIELSVSDKITGRGVKTHGILEVFDNRVASKSAKEPLDSSIGDSFRGASDQIASWRDWSGYDRLEDCEMLSESVMTNFAPPPTMSAPAPMGVVSFSEKDGIVGGSGAVKRMARPVGLSAQSAAGSGAFGHDVLPPAEAIREGEKKVVYCAAVVTDHNGRARIEAELPPQTGRCKARFIAIDKFDYREKIQEIDCEKKSYVESSVNTLLMPGAKLSLKASVVNSSGENIRLKISGACLEKEESIEIKEKVSEAGFKLVGRNYGKLSLSLVDKNDKTLDRRDFTINNIASMPVSFSDVIISDGAAIKIEKAGAVAIYSNPARLMDNIIANMNTVMYSWFGHAEAISASIAIRAMILRAAADKLISSEGLYDKLILDLKKSVKDFNESYYDKSAGLVYPYPGSPVNLNFSAWAAKNLSAAVAAISGSESLKAELEPQYKVMAEILEKMIPELAKRKVSMHETAFFDPDVNSDVIPVEIDGKVIYKAPVDSAVIDFFTQKFIPVIDVDKIGRPDRAAAFTKAYDTYRFLKAFERSGMLYYTLINMKALLKKNDKNFFKLFNEVSKGLINTNEPGLIQGPAMLGGVYSAPQTFVKYIELLIEMARIDKIAKEAAIEIVVNGKSDKVIVSDGPYIIDGAGADITVKMPAFAALRYEREHEINIYDHLEKPSFFKLASDKNSYQIGSEGTLTAVLDDGIDAGEYYALIAAPSNLSIRQSEDILSDYRGQLLYGQKSSGAVKMQFITVPFRGSKTLNVSLEGAVEGESEGFVCVRHISNPEKIVTLKTEKMTVK